MEKKLKSIAVSIVVFAVIFGLTAPVQAQVYAVYGQVFDTNGVTPVDGVNVTVTCLNTAESVSYTTSNGGLYSVSLGNPPYPLPELGDTLRIFADAGDGRTNTTELTATGAPQRVDLILEEDTIPPITNITAITPGPNKYGWNNVTPVTVSFNRSDDKSGVAYTNYSTTSIGGPWITETGEVPFDVAISTEGITTIWYYSVDNAENPEDTKSVEVKIDLTEPTVVFIDPTPADESVNTTGYVNVTVEVTDPAPGSGLEDVVNISVWNETGLYLYNTTYNFDVHKYYYNVSAPDDTPLPNGNYTYKVYAKDLAGNTGMSEMRGVTVVKMPSEYNFTIDFVTGYNMISLPVNDTSIINASLLATDIGGNCTQISKWDTVDQKYVTYVPGFPLNDFDVVGGGGYFVKMTDPATVIFTGKGWESPFTISLVTGYNMIGIPVNDTSIINASLLATDIGGNCTQISKWDTVDQKYVTYVPGFPLNDFDVVGGGGYFVKMTDPATVIFAGEAWSD